MTTFYQGNVLFAGGGATSASGAVDVRAEGSVTLSELGSGEAKEYSAQLETVVTRPDPEDLSRFAEHGRVIVEGLGSLTIETFGLGGDGPGAIAGWIQGYAVFHVVGGDGAFENASGYVTTNFSVDPHGVMYDSESLMVVVP